MSNRRMGGMGGFNRGNNRSFSQQPFQGGLSPWQGNANSMNQGGLLSQLTSNPQLALALTSLLQPQQQQPPSLLSLNTAPAFSNDRDFGRFGNRGRDNRRHEPYNKQNRGGGGWRMESRNRGGGNRNQNKDRRRSPRRDDKKKNDTKKDQDKKETKQKDKNDTADTVDLSMDEEKEDERKESKRDWKDEKNHVEGKDESGDEAEDKKNEEARNKEGRFTGVPAKYLNCFVCNKQMWDGESMGKHVRGRAHQQMMKSLEESIHITVGILRENMRLTEERKMIEWNRMSRQKKYGNKYNEPESHCNMCDLKFMGKIVSHRRTDGHQRLKRYLHPNCHICDKEFPSRLEWIEHRLTPEHLRKLHETTEKKVGGKDGMEITEGNGEEEDLQLEAVLEESLEMESERPILELDDNLEGMQNLLPSYKRDRALGTKCLKPFTGHMCELCNRSFADEQDAQDHLKTKRHFYKFVEAIKEKFVRKERREKKEKEEAAKKKKQEEESNENEEAETKEEPEADAEEEQEPEDQEMYDPEEVTNNEEDTSANITQEDEEEDGDPSVIKMDDSQPPVDEEVKEEEEEEEETKPKVEEVVKKEEVKKEVKKEAATPAKPAASPAKKTNVKNGAGPRSKKLSEPSSEATPKANLESFHIPKKTPAKSQRGRAQRGK